MWNEVAGELAQEGLRPVSPDQECLQDIMHTHEEKAEETLKLQVCVCVCFRHCQALLKHLKLEYKPGI